MKPLHVRRERFDGRGRKASVRVLFASDLHLGLPWTRHVPDALVEAAELASPDVVLIGGDLVDNARGLDSVEGCVAALARRWPVAAIPGNHDVATGIEDVRARVVRAGVTWLPDAPMTLAAGAGLLRICARPDQSPDAGATNVLCLHDPAGAEDAAEAGFDVAFAGHLHGGQCVLFERRGRLFPGAWFNRWTGLRFQLGGLRLFVSRGLGDTLPLRFNCPREVIVCEIGAGCAESAG